MFNKLHIPARVSLLVVLLSAAVFGQDRVIIRVSGDIGEVASRLNLKVIKSLTGSAAGLHVVSSKDGKSALHTLRSLSLESTVQSAEPEKPVQLPGLSS